MKNYEEKEKKLNNVLKKLNTMSNRVVKMNKDVGLKFGNKNNLNQKIDELNQETETLIDEIEKWQT